MPKQCIICSKEAEFQIKDSNECYCKECASDQFNDLSYLQKIEEEAKKLKDFINKKMEDE